MFEKVNAGHPDKMADRLAGAVVDLVYERAGGLTKANPRVACEVMAGHGRVDVQIETSLGRLDLRADDLDPLIHRLFGERVEGNVLIAPQDPPPVGQPDARSALRRQRHLQGLSANRGATGADRHRRDDLRHHPLRRQVYHRAARRAVGLDHLPKPPEPRTGTDPRTSGRC